MYGSLLIAANMHTIDAVVKNQPASAGETRDSGSIIGLGRSSRVGNGNQSSILIWKISWTENPGGLQSTGSLYSCLENPMDRGIRQATVYRVAKELEMT